MFIILMISRKKKLETCLNGKYAYVYGQKRLKSIVVCSADLSKHDSVPNQLYAQKQPGLYMIRCIINDWRYYGESSNVSGRLASHKSLLNGHIHPNICLQNDWNDYGQRMFEFVVLFMGLHWDQSYVRRGKETELIVLNRNLAYNILEDASRAGEKNSFWKRLHTPETKKKISQALKGRSNDLLGQKVSIKGKIYPSIAEASRQTNIARKTIRNKINNSVDSDYYKMES